MCVRVPSPPMPLPCPSFPQGDQENQKTLSWVQLVSLCAHKERIVSGQYQVLGRRPLVQFRGVQMVDQYGTTRFLRRPLEQEAVWHALAL